MWKQIRDLGLLDMGIMIVLSMALTFGLIMGCGNPDTINKSDQPKLKTSVSTVKITPEEDQSENVNSQKPSNNTVSTNSAPVAFKIEKFRYRSNPIQLSWWVPIDQIANYTIFTCERGKKNGCLALYEITCTSSTICEAKDVEDTENFITLSVEQETGQKVFSTYDTPNNNYLNIGSFYLKIIAVSPSDQKVARTLYKKLRTI
ncbi:MAG: hypothetical protein HY843_04755 [Bdellovibrio sp.]|nr:hypothetical protein [Bdellovibrio sp.]